MWSGVRLTWKAPLGRCKLDCKCSLSGLAVVPFQVGRAVFGTVLTHRSVLQKKKERVEEKRYKENRPRGRIRSLSEGLGA